MEPGVRQTMHDGDGHNLYGVGYDIAVPQLVGSIQGHYPEDGDDASLDIIVPAIYRLLGIS